MNEQAKAEWEAPSASADQELTGVTGGVATWNGKTTLKGQKIGRVHEGTEGVIMTAKIYNTKGGLISRIVS